MKLFHGTSYKLGDTILKEGIIKIGQPAFDIVTDSNYVYLTNRITVAMNYGRKKAVFLDEEQFYLFEMELNKEQLLVDFDEVEIYKDGFSEQKAAIESLNGQYTVENTLSILYSARVDFDINLHNYNCKYATFSVDDMDFDINEDIFQKNLNEQELLRIYNSITWHSI
ncbi:hypothetical protein BAMA_10315 [Bacillus manliponensis]|uniref:Uncharacterized protein n=1 Tax=Bacillus manliponensis TaxID=574376 RepID=A0A073K6J4_9BACI|nr:hypothetical protein [Bacillus manliponensis]KEK17878.1 hypothetical protein BAMA_10315 [Bacillus manliponensis]